MLNQSGDKPLLLEEGVTIDDAIRALSRNGTGYLAVVNKSNVLVGIITDADIRRAVLDRKLELEQIINRRPKVLPHDSSKQKIINILRKHRRRHMPLVKPGGVYAGVVTLDDIDFNAKQNAVLIMAGGLGSRMGELTKDTPKPMLKVAGKPVLEHIIERFSEYGFTHFLISVNYKSEVIKNYFKDGSAIGVDIEYIEETKRLGTAGALSLIRNKVSEPFVVVNGDVLTHLDHAELLHSHIESKSVATMCVREFVQQIPYGVVEFDPETNLISGIREKPEIVSHVNAGIYVISPEVLEFVPDDTFYDMPTLFEELQDKDKDTQVFVVDEYWIDIGHKEQYYKANTDFAESE